VNFFSAGSGVIPLLITLLLFLLFQRWLQREMQWVFLLITRSSKAALVVFSTLFFPGVLLHEGSHFIMARLLKVRTGRISLLPRALPNHRLQLGFVETAPSDALRDSLIGLAPLLTGGLAVTLIGAFALGLVDAGGEFIHGQWPTLWGQVYALPTRPDFWLWLYLLFTISSTMMPSPSDRQAWLPLIAVMVVIAAAALLAGAGPWLSANLSPYLEILFSTLTMVFGMGLLAHVVLLPPTVGVRMLLQKFFPF
jgi:hypothetical protein